jgi:hypothetical protein
MRSVRAFSMVVLLLAAACGDDSGPTDEDNGALGPVRGDLEITAIEVSQSVVQPVYLDGEVVNPATYGVPLVPHRHMWVRALWDPPLEWTPRPLIARLHIEFPDGTEVVYDDRETASGHPPVVQGKSSPTDMLSSFYWRLDPEDVVPGIRYSVSVIEAEPVPDIPVSTGKTRWPREENTALPVQSAPSVLRLSLVGVRYDVPGCSTDTSMLPDDELEAIRSGFEVWNAVGTNRVEIDTSLSIDITTPTDPFTLLEIVGPIRAQYPELVDAFFYILLDDCQPFPNGVLGVAPVNSDPPVLGEATMRYGAGLWNPNDVRESVNTAIHEIGHSQGAFHAPCGGADGPDPAYPHPEATLGARGLDPLTAQFYDPSAYKDFMSYCRPYWVSDYRFSKNYVVQSTLTSFAGAGMLPPTQPPGYSGIVLTGIVQPDGESRWWINENPMPPAVRADAPMRLELRTQAGELELPADARPLPEMPGAYLVSVPLVDALQIEQVDDIQTIAVHLAVGEGAMELSVMAPQVTDRRNLEFHQDLTAR